MNKKKKLITLASLTLMGLALGLYIEDQSFVAREKKILLRSPKIKSDIRITQISDFHSNVLKNLEEVLTNIKKFDPHFIILTGDILDYGTEKKIERSVYFLKKLMKLNKKTYFITGNHEEGGPNKDKFIDIIKSLGIIYLDNESKTFSIDDQEIYLYGASYFNFDYKNYSPSDESINIVLSHYSKNIRDNLRGSEDFIFSGHTHGGQVRFPFIGAALAPGEGDFPKYDMGIFDIYDTILYIDSGLGNTFMPLRFLNPIGYSSITCASSLVVK